jgi:hypothetical protein
MSLPAATLDAGSGEIHPLRCLQQLGGMAPDHPQTDDAALEPWRSFFRSHFER